MTERAAERLQSFLPAMAGTLASRLVTRKAFGTPALAAGAWHKHLHTRSCNQSAAEPVMVNGVDALSITWMILMQALWLKLRFKTTTTQLARWCDGFIRWLPRSSVRIERVEPRRKISAR